MTTKAGPTGKIGTGPCPAGPSGPLGEPGIQEADVLVEYRGKDNGQDVHNTSNAKLYVDKARNRIGVRGPGVGDGECYVPLSDVLDLLKKGVL